VSVVAATLIAGGWFWVSSPHRSSAAPQKIADAHAAFAPAKPAAASHDPIEVTGSITERAAAPLPQPNQACANPDALGVSRVVEVDTTGGPGFGFEHFKQFDFPGRQGSRADLR
jgi:hypothetical protein